MKKPCSFSASLRLCGSKAPFLTKEGWQRLPLTGWFFLAILIVSSAAFAQTYPAPKDTLGFTPGDDRKLASWASIVDYFKQLDKASDRMIFEEIGKTTMGAPFVFATISSPENLKSLEKYKQINAKLADPRKLGTPASLPARDAAAKKLIAQGKTIVLITCGIHSTEVGSTLSSMLIAHKLTSSNEAEIQKILENTIILLVPSLNPDGVDIVKNWYDKTLGTPYEGTEPPELYHKYVGHDNNRDWYAFTQVETQLTVDKIHNVWHPQIVHDIHQQGSNGSRLFLPPYMQPVEPNVPKQIVESYTELGNWMAADLRKKGLEGITTGTTYDAWTPARAYSHYHGGVRILSETASAKLATPVNIKFENLRTDIAGGLNAKVESPNFGPVWKGGEWKLRNITDYMTTAAFSLLSHAAGNRERWLSRFYEIGKEAVRPRRTGDLNGFVFPEVGFDDVDKLGVDSDLGANERQGYLLSILSQAGIEIDYPDSLVIGGTRYPKRTAVVKLGQPYGSFAKALLESQKYPDLKDSTGNPIPPYDVTAHTLSLLIGVESEAVYTPFRYRKPTGGKGEGRGSGCGSSHPPRYSIYKSAMPSMDEGWTRWLFRKPDGYQAGCEDSVDNIFDSEIRENLSGIERPDTIVFPDQSPNQILNGYAKGAMPEEYTGGVGKEGVENLRKFVEAGGTLVFLNRASNFAIEQFNLPVRDVTRGLSRKDFYIPGSILRTELDLTHPIAKGMPQQSIAWFENSPAFEALNTTSSAETAPIINSPPCLGGVPEGRGGSSENALVSFVNVGHAPPCSTTPSAENHPVGETPTPLLRKEGSQNATPSKQGGELKAGLTRNFRIIATYPKDPKQILLSGWALGAEKIAGKAALVEFSIGKGKIILFGFRPQYRGQSLATFPLLFNAISQ